MVEIIYLRTLPRPISSLFCPLRELVQFLLKQPLRD